MKLNKNLVVALGTAIILGCSSEESPTTPKPEGDNPFKGKWRYVKVVSIIDGGNDTIDYTSDWEKDFILFHDSTGRRIVFTRPTDSKDSLHYRYTPDSLFTTTSVENFLNFKGRPYEFKGSEKDTLDLSDSSRIEILVRAK